MFSKEFMRYLINYQPDGFEYDEKKTEQVKSIEFKDRNKGLLAKVYVSVNSK